MILCCGEALIDMLPRQTTQGEDAFAPYAGGAVFNTAIALGRLDAPAGFFCGMSRDLFGELLEETLAASNVSCDLAHRSDAPTTLAFVRLTNGQASYTFYDENSALSSMTEADLPALPDTVEAMFFGGISLAGKAAPAYEALMLREAPTRVTMIDPNIRPSFITDPDTYRARIHAMMAAADIVKLSDEDLNWLEGDGDLAALAQGLLGRGTKLVLITKGSEGATAYFGSGAVSAAAVRVEVVDTVGAGDTFNAGFLAGLHQANALSKDALSNPDEAILKDALSLGVRSAAITVSRAGANPPRTSEL